MSCDALSFAAAEWTGSGFRLTSVPVTEPAAGEVRVRVSACGACLTEVHFVHGYYDELVAPPRLGHEFAGVVDAIGPEASGRPGGHSGAGLAPGDPAAGFDLFGGFAEQVTGPEAMFQALPPGLPADHGCFPRSRSAAACRRSAGSARRPARPRWSPAPAATACSSPSCCAAAACGRSCRSPTRGAVRSRSTSAPTVSLIRSRPR